MIYIFLALGLYTFAILLGTAAARNVNSNIASVVTTIISALATSVVVLPFVSKKMVEGHRFGIIMAALGGISVALFTVMINKAFVVNKVGIVSPIVLGGAIFLSTVFSYFIFKEKVSTVQFIGLLVMAVGLSVVIYARATER